MSVTLEKYNTFKRSSSISIKPYSDPSIPNMGLEKYGMAIFEGVTHEESIIYLDPTGNGKRRYITGLNEFAPEVQSLPIDDKKAKIKDIRETVVEIEKYFGNSIDPKDNDFWDKVKTARPDNYDFWDKIKIRLTNDPVFLEPKNDIYDLIKIKAIEAGGFSFIASSLDDVRKKVHRGVKFYLDRFEQTASIKTEVKKLRNAALAYLDNLYKSNVDKLFLVCKVIDDHSVQYKKSTPIDIMYNNMDMYINGETVERDKKQTATHFSKIAELSMEELKLRAIVKDATYYRLIAIKGDGFIYHVSSNTLMGKNPSDVIEFLNNPLNENILAHLLKNIEAFWNE